VQNGGGWKISIRQEVAFSLSLTPVLVSRNMEMEVHSSALNWERLCPSTASSDCALIIPIKRLQTEKQMHRWCQLKAQAILPGDYDSY